MAPLVVATAALAAIIWEIRHPQPYPRLGLRVIRAVPFTFVALLSLISAGAAPVGRHPFQVDFSLAREDLARSMTKLPHLQSIAVLFLLAVVAFGVLIAGIRWLLAGRGDAGNRT